MQPNILLITVDQMRRDACGAYGNDVIHTPHLDAMCGQGHLFTHAYSATPTCVPARAALLTGMKQRHHGRVGYKDGVSWTYDHTLPGELTKAGYQTQCIGKMHVHPQRNCCGFENVILHDGYLHYARNHSKAGAETYEGSDDYLTWLKEQKGHRADLLETGLDPNSWVMRTWPYEEEYHPTNWCATETLNFFRRRDPTRPFFLHTSFVRPHAPLDPPAFFLDLYKDARLPEPLLGDWEEETEENNLPVDCKKGRLSKENRRRALAAYYALITQVDYQIGRILKGMHEYGLLANTIVLFTADHGELMGDHNWYRKSLPFEGSAGIPFLLYDPANLLHLPQGGKCDTLVELRDVMPTLLDLAGAPIPETVDGKSVLPLLRGEEKSLREYIHGEHFYDAASNHFIVTEKEKYIWFSQDGRELYFDLSQDPGECHDCSKEPGCQKRIEELRKKLIEELTEREEGYTDGKKLIPGRPAQSILSEVFGFSM